MEVVDAYLRRATILVLALKWLLLKSRKWFTGIYNSIMLAMCQTENYNSIWVNVSNLSYTLSRHSLTQITLPYEDRNGQHRVHPSIKFLSIRVITHSHGGAICNGQLFDDKRQDDVASNRELTGAEFCSILVIIRHVVRHVDYFFKRSATHITLQKVPGINGEEYLISVNWSTSENMQLPWNGQANTATLRPSKVWSILCQPNGHIPRRGRVYIA